jgi:spore germination protein YaaH
VDWIGVKYECADETIKFARSHLKPVMLIAASQGADWETGFAPLIKFISDNNDVVRAATYINDVPMSAEVIKQWKVETKRPFWLRASPKLFGELGFDK